MSSALFQSINPTETYLGPLTTVFTPPSTCSQIVTVWSRTEYVIFHGIYGDSKCYPPGVDILSQKFLRYYWSPGICPSGFTEACQDRQRWPAGVTASLCCPSGYTCGGFTYGADNTAPYCEWTFSTTVTNVWIGTGTNPTGVPGDASFSTLNPPVRIWLNAVPIVWQSTDESLLAKTTQTLSSTFTTRTVVSVVATTLEPVITSTTDLPTHPILSAGAKAGIGVAIPLAVLAGILLSFLLFRRASKRKQMQQNQDQMLRKAEPPGESRYPPEAQVPSESPW